MKNNNLSGKVPSLEKLNRIIYFRIASNNLGNGGENNLSFLYSLTNATYLTSLEINANNFGGELPKCVANLSTTLTNLLLNKNKIFGNIPNGIGNLINLQRLDIWQNKLSGNIPFEIGKLQKLQSLALDKNDFYGNIPSSIGNLTLLTDLYLEENNLQGNILSLNKCQNLIFLNLSNNNLSGSISPQVIGLSFKPIGLGLAANQFTGVLPMEVGNFIYLQYLDISENMLFGNFQASL
jgi:Leucine-rich repeat (LRR) protein